VRYKGITNSMAVKEEIKYKFRKFDVIQGTD